ncbi:MAG: NADH:ubiquinone reductase (Na(+)-transporting) subunit A, partial [Bacteroidales bacterium]|nr:NADH:ubiquinone reductase (Na(+)-transporting) subunit A [Bacteroidales bacterium]
GVKEEETLYGQKCGVRYVSGNPLSGENVGRGGYLGFYDDQVTLLTEGNYRELFGWAKVFRPKKFSTSKTYFSWLCPKKAYKADTNVNGGERAFIVNGVYEKVLPMDIYPVYLLKAILAQDIEKMEQFGIYEVIGEDLALCEYICPSKIEIQKIVEDGINLMLKEMA